MRATCNLLFAICNNEVNSESTNCVRITLQPNSRLKEPVSNETQTCKQCKDAQHLYPGDHGKPECNKEDAIRFPSPHLSSPNSELQNIAAVLAFAMGDECVQFAGRTNNKRHRSPLVLSISECPPGRHFQTTGKRP